MNQKLLDLIRCPVTGTRFRLEIIEKDNSGKVVTGILFAENEWFYPIIESIPRLTVEAFLDYAAFFEKHLPDYNQHANEINSMNEKLINYVVKKNKRTKASFSQEWQIYDREKDKTWNLDDEGLLNQFLKETDENLNSIKNKKILDAGCGNGQLDLILAKHSAQIVAMDFSQSIVNANKQNHKENLFFIQGDVQFPPFEAGTFDIVHSSGVLIHTNAPELTFVKLDSFVRNGGKMSVWLYHPRKDFIHRLMNTLRKTTSRLPLKFQYYLYSVTIFPVSFLIKRIKGNKQNRREMMVDILDWMTPEFRWEFTHDQARAWFDKRNYKKTTITTSSVFGFNITGIKSLEQ